MTLNQFRNAVDTKLANWWPHFTNKQDIYFSINGHYWQGMFTHVVAPNTTTADSTDIEVAVDNVTQKPTDQTIDWITAFPNMPTSLSYRLMSNIWTGEDGVKGYTAVIQVRHNGLHYQRSKSMPDDRFTQSWFRLSGPSQSGL